MLFYAQLKNITKHPLFLIGLGCKIILVLFLFPILANNNINIINQIATQNSVWPISDWYVPFLELASQNINALLNPWQAWLGAGETLRAFPYGYAMWFFLLPLHLIFTLLSLSSLSAYGFTIILADLLLLLLFLQLLPNRKTLLLAIYWLSPIMIIASYILGFNDVIPIMMLSAALYCIKKNDYFLSGLLIVTAISAKLSMVIALPFIVIYLWRNQLLRAQLKPFLTGFMIASAALLLPFIISDAARLMLFSNPEMLAIYQLNLAIGDNKALYFVPIFYLILLYVFWRIKKCDFDIFYTMLNINFFIIVLMSPSSLGWFIWIIPFLIFSQRNHSAIDILLASSFSLLYVLNSINIAQIIVSDSFLMQNIPSLLHSLMVAVGLILIARIWRDNILQNDFYKFSRQPFALGVAGDSGAGKDNFCSTLIDLFGEKTVTHLSGDDYHLWDRHKPLWQVLTHLNPMANDLERFADDVVQLSNQKSIKARHYDHHTGKMSHFFTVRSNDFIIASGLHALYLPILRQKFHLRVFLDMAQDLRHFFKLKRDVTVRGHSKKNVLASIQKRLPDAERFIKPQAEHADLIFSLDAIDKNLLQDENNDNIRLQLHVTSRKGIDMIALHRALVGICGLNVTHHAEAHKNSDIIFTVTGDVNAEALALAARIICPRMFEFISPKAIWYNDVTGLMQLITLLHINSALTEQFS
ncbi:MAG: uridine kinase [Alphaproteobacteria bacterium]|nr:uridine kinase [Alphaproteobacteria bacterium]